MEKKNKIITALAIGAVAILIGSGVARCSMEQSTVPEEDQSAPIVEQSGSGASSGIYAEDSQDTQTANTGGIETYANTQWSAEDKSSTLALMGGILVERTEDDSKVIYYTVKSEDDDADGFSSVVTVSDSLTGDEHESLIRIEHDSQGRETLSCDELASLYILDAPIDVDFTIKGTTDRLFQAFGKDADDFNAAIIPVAKQRSPYATSADWDGQLWIDCIAGTTVTNFVLDDSASTLISVCMDASGELVAS